MRLVVPIITIVIAFSVPAWGQGGGNPKIQEKAAKKACAAGDVRKGVEILADLYVETNNPAHTYNQGRCYEQNHQWVSAIDRFREYLRTAKGLKAIERSEVEKHIADCEAFQEKEEAKLAPTAVVAPPPTVVVEPPPPPPPSPPPVAMPVAVEQQPVTQAEKSGSGLRVAGIVIGSLGIASAATGLVLNLKANNLGDEYNRTGEPGTKSSHSSYKTGSIVCYGAGGALVVTGVALYLLGRSENHSEQTSRVSVLPILTSSQFSIAMESRF